MKGETLSHSLEIESTADAVSSALDRLEVLLGEHGIDHDRCLELRLVSEEVLTNILKYADVPAMQAHIAIDARTLELEFRDRGAPFDPLARVDPDLDQDVSERPLGGLGIHLVKQLVEDVSYRREDGQNVLRLVNKR